MAARLIVHIGQQKSGTTYLQGILARSTVELAAAGITYPLVSRPRRGRTVENHEPATYGFLAHEYPWVAPTRVREERPNWDRLVAAVRDDPGTVLLSAEALSVIREPAIRQLVDGLGGGATEIVITTRRLDRSLPSLWQQHVRNGRSTGLATYLRGLSEQRDLPIVRIEGDSDQQIWRAFAVGRLARRWAAVVGPDQVRVVVNPGPATEVLWPRFSQAIGSAGLVAAPGAAASLPVHTSLSGPEAAVLAAINAALSDAGWEQETAERLRLRIIRDGFQGRPERGRPIAIPPPFAERVAAWSAADLDELRATGVEVIGEIGELRVPVDRRPFVPVFADEVAGAAAAAMIGAALDPEHWSSSLARIVRRAVPHRIRVRRPRRVRRPGDSAKHELG